MHILDALASLYHLNVPHKYRGAGEKLPSRWERHQVSWEWVFCSECGKTDAKGRRSCDGKIGFETVWSETLRSGTVHLNDSCYWSNYHEHDGKAK